MNIKTITNQDGASVDLVAQIKQLAADELRAIADSTFGAVFVIADGAVPNLMLRFSDGVSQSIKNLPEGDYVLVRLTDGVLQKAEAPKVGLFVFGEAKA